MIKIIEEDDKEFPITLIFVFGNDGALEQKLTIKDARELKDKLEYITQQYT